MQSILELLDENNIIWNRFLTDNEIVEIYKATTEEEATQYMLLIQDFLENYTVPKRVSDLTQAVSYLNLEAMIYKNWMLPIAKEEISI